jgi:hypothetical protein
MKFYDANTDLKQKTIQFHQYLNKYLIGHTLCKQRFSNNVQGSKAFGVIVECTTVSDCINIIVIISKQENSLLKIAYAFENSEV